MLKYTFLLIFISSGVLLRGQELPVEQKDSYIHSIFFGGGSYYIDVTQVEELREFLESVPGIEEYEINVQSHTDNIGSKEYNQWLSSMRSESTISKLIAENIPPGLIQISDFGEDSPVFDNRTWDGKRANRRVDIILIRIVQ